MPIKVGDHIRFVDENGRLYDVGRVEHITDYEIRVQCGLLGTVDEAKYAGSIVVRPVDAHSKAHGVDDD